MPVNQALSVFQLQFYQRFTNILGEPDLLCIIPELEDWQNRWIKETQLRWKHRTELCVSWQLLYPRFAASGRNPSYRNSRIDTQRLSGAVSHYPVQLSSKFWSYLSDLHEQAKERLDLSIEQMNASESVTKGVKAADQLALQELWIIHRSK